MFSRSLLLTIFGLLLSVNAAPFFRKHWSEDVGPHARCNTHISADDKAEFHQGLHQARELWAREAAALSKDGMVVQRRELWNDTFVFNVSFNVVYTNETREGGFISDADIKAQIDTLNKDYNSTGISWNLINTTRINNPDWFVNAYPGSPQEKEMKLAHNVGDATVLNVYTLTFNSTTKSLGTSSIPSAYFRDPKSDGVMVRHSTITNGIMPKFNLGRTLTHEVGHWLGLFHTFEGGCDNGVGDNVADTPPQSSGSEGCPVGRDSCPGDGPDLINNFMDYSDDSCMTGFTPGQAERMRESARAFRRPGGKTMADTATVVATSTTSTSTPTATETSAAASATTASASATETETNAATTTPTDV